MVCVGSVSLFMPNPKTPAGVDLDVADAMSRKMSSHRDRQTSTGHSTNIHIGGLHMSVCEGRLFEAFSRCGPITSIRIVGKQRRSTKVGFITFASSEGAQKAVETMNGALLCGKAVVVSASTSSRELHERPLKYVPYHSQDPIVVALAANKVCLCS